MNTHQIYYNKNLPKHITLHPFDISYFLPHERTSEKEILSETTKKLMKTLNMPIKETVNDKLENQYASIFMIQRGGQPCPISNQNKNYVQQNNTGILREINDERGTNIILKQAGVDVRESIETKLNNQLISALSNPLHLQTGGNKYIKLKKIYLQLKNKLRQ
jgi:hypothetical protein